MKFRLVLVCLVFSLVANSQTLTRKAVLNKGQQLEQSSQIKMNMTQEMMGQQMEILMETTVSNTYDVKDVNAGNINIGNTLKRIVMDMSAAGQKQTFDSDKKEDIDGQMGGAFKDKINKTKEFTVDKTGKITAVKDTASDMDKSGMMGMMPGNFGSEEKVGGQFAALANLPEKGVKVGESWTDSLVDDKAKTVNRYTLKSVTGNQGLVTLSSDLVVKGEIEQQNMTMIMDMTGTSTGEYTFDTTTGIISSRKLLTKANGTLEVMGQAVPLKMETTVTSTTTKK